MKLLISIYFFILAIIQMGLFFGVYHYYRSQNLVRPSPYWMASLLASILALLVFGIGVIVLVDAKNPQFNFTIANALFYIAAVLQALFCRSLIGNISTKLKVGFGVSLILFMIVFEYMRVHANFEIRTIFVVCLISALYAWQIIMLGRKNKKNPSKQLLYLQYATSAEILFALSRIAVLTFTALPIMQVEQIPQILILFTIAQLVMTTLSYIAIGGYWAEQIASANAKSQAENEEIKRLLMEREQLIVSLLKANKSASTGALSASIAHELNQPLGASNLNIQFLQKKLADGELNPDLQKEIYATLLSDNHRAARIIRSLRSIFSDGEVETAQVNLGDLIQAVLNIAKPEIASKNIQIVLRLEPNLLANANSSELQQVILNLINNAIDALASSQRIDKKLTIEGAYTDSGVQLSVADNGGGLSEEAQSHLFELLSSTKGSGMGLGLWLCKHIISRHGGVIRCEASSDDGAKFVFQLPYAKARGA
jgi:signal transduction histidine kinase